MNNIKQFNFCSPLQEAIYYFLIINIINGPDKKELVGIFKGLDKDNDGCVSKMEFIEGLKNWKPDISEEEIEDIIKKIDWTKGKGMEFTEFTASAIDRTSIFTDAKLIKCFRLLDKDNSGKISLSEFRQVF